MVRMGRRANPAPTVGSVGHCIRTEGDRHNCWSFTSFPLDFFPADRLFVRCKTNALATCPRPGIGDRRALYSSYVTGYLCFIVVGESKQEYKQTHVWCDTGLLLFRVC